MKKKSFSRFYIFLCFLLLCAAIAYMIGALDVSWILKDPAVAWKRVCKPLLRIVFFISIGLFVGQMIEAMGWTNRLAILIRPLMRWGHLTEKMAAAFTAAFISGITALAMIVSFYKDGVMNEKEVTLAVLLNTFPSYFLHLPTTIFVILPLAGSAGAIYLLITFFAAVLRLVVVLIWSRNVLPERAHFAAETRNTDSKDWKKVLRDLKAKFLTRLARIMVLVLPIYVLILFLSHAGFFVWLRKALAQHVGSTLMPVDAMSIVVVSLMTEFTSGYAAAGAMLEAGTLNVPQTVLALLAGNIISSPIRAFRHQMPVYLGIFSPAMGTRLIIMTQVFRVLSLILSGALFFLLVYLSPELHF